MAASGSRRVRGLVGIAVVAVLAAVATGVAVDMALGGSSDSSDAVSAAPTSADVSGEASQFTAVQPPQPQSPLDQSWKLSTRVEHAIPLGEAVGSAGGGGNEIALSFDDGPSVYTSQVLDILDRHGAKATFFVVGRNAELNPQLMRRAVESGHEIGNHTWSHTSLTALRRRARDATRWRARATSSAPPPGTSRCCSGRPTARCGRARTARCASSGCCPSCGASTPATTTRASRRRRSSPASARRCGPARSSSSTTAAATARRPSPRSRRSSPRWRRRATAPVTVTQLLNDAPPEQDDLAGRM